LPDWQIENNRVAVTVWGKVIDLNYCALLATQNISFDDTFLLNQIQLKHDLSKDEIAYLERKHWISGRKDSLSRIGPDKGGYWQVYENL
jgi:ATP-dependent DNA helicase RecG